MKVGKEMQLTGPILEFKESVRHIQKWHPTFSVTS